ncbi:MAG: ATP-binding cassette domain-containing protein [Gaiellaceae bacterium MAG52_C11]|nr:ATP-binding cassette domain-containing protein [Candidatus Gaiellasilicea maunaloa]
MRGALKRHSTPVVLIALVTVVTMLGALGSAVLQTTVVTMLINLILVVGLYVFVGNSGVFSFGQIGFMAIGAYTAATLRIPETTKNLLYPTMPDVEVPSIVATLVAGGAAALVALVIAVPLMRLSGLVASLGTFAFLNIVYIVASNLDEVTGGSTGLGGVPASTTPYTALIWTIAVILIAWWFQQTSISLRLRGSREDEAAARAIGIGITRERTAAYVLSAFITGIGGGLFAQFYGTFNPAAFFVATTFATVAMLVVGGVLSLSGAVVGTIFISLLSEGLLRIEAGWDFGLFVFPETRGLQQVAIALAMLAVLLLRPRGLTDGEEIAPTRIRRLLRWRSLRPRTMAERAIRRLPQLARRDAATETGSRADTPLLAVENLTVHYGNVAAVQGISLEVEESELVGLIGANGAGKSTTLATIAGFLAPASGRVELEGRSLVGDTPERIVRRGVALVPEGRHIFGTLSVAENLQLGTTAIGDRGLIDETVEDVLERFPVLRRYYRSSAAKLSGGEQQQLAIARALLSRPRLLLLDEPSLGLAPLMVDVVFDTLAQLRDSGTTILLVEQNAAATVELADRTYVLRTGRIVTSGTREELLASTDVAEAYLGVRA